MAVNYTNTNPKLPSREQKNAVVPRKIFLKRNIDYVTRANRKPQGSFNTGNANDTIDLYGAIQTSINRAWINIGTGEVTDPTTSSTGTLQDALDNVYAEVGGGAADGSETKINAGTNISVSGNGTVGSPYVVTNTFASGSTSNLNGAIGRYNDPGHWLLGGSDTSGHQVAEEYTAIITKGEGVNNGQYLHIKFGTNPTNIGMMVQVEGVMVQDGTSQVFPVNANCVMVNFGGTSVSHSNDNSWTTDQVFEWYYSTDNLPVLRITNARNLIGMIDITITTRRAFSSGLTLPDVSNVAVNNTANHF